MPSPLSLCQIGYGSFTPQTDNGKLFTGFLAIPSIVLYMRLVSCVGEYMSYMAHACKRNCLGSWRSETQTQRRASDHRATTSELTFGCAVFLLILSAVIFAVQHLASDVDHIWTFGECAYFIIITLTTVGLGDYTPTHVSSDAGGQRFWVLFCLTLMGLGLVAATLDSYYMETAAKMRGLSHKLQKACIRGGRAAEGTHHVIIHS